MDSANTLHHVPGRLRVKIPALKSNPQKSNEINDLLDLYGVHTVRVNTMTGSTIVTYDPDRIGVERLLQVLKESGHYDGALDLESADPVQQVTDKAVRRLGRAVFGWAVGRALEANGLSLIAAFI
jgi:copper chaperone CopZ